jgi:hypothetical protein
MNDFGRLLIGLGLLLLIVGGLFLLLPRVGLNLGHLPGDFRFQFGKITYQIPLTSGILLSILLTLVLNLLARFINR